MLITPNFKILINGDDKTIDLRVVSFTLSDFSGENIDTLNLTLAPNGFVPKAGDELTLYMGYDKNLVLMGVFFVNKILENYLQNIQLESTAMDLGSELKTLKSRSWDVSYTEILETIAKENGLKTQIDIKRGDEVVHYDQNNQSDSAMAQALSVELNALFKIANKTLIFKDHDKIAKNFAINADDCVSLSFEKSGAVNFECCVAEWSDQFGIVESQLFGDPKGRTLRLSTNAKSSSEALKIAQTELEKANFISLKGNLKAKGEPLFAGGTLTLTLRGEKINSNITKITHEFSNAGWAMDVEFSNVESE